MFNSGDPKWRYLKETQGNYLSWSEMDCLEDMDAKDLMVQSLFINIKDKSYEEMIFDINGDLVTQNMTEENDQDMTANDNNNNDEITIVDDIHNQSNSSNSASINDDDDDEMTIVENINDNQDQSQVQIKRSSTPLEYGQIKQSPSPPEYENVNMQQRNQQHSSQQHSSQYHLSQESQHQPYTFSNQNISYSSSNALTTTHQSSSFDVGTPLQSASASAFDEATTSPFDEEDLNVPQAILNSNFNNNNNTQFVPVSYTNFSINQNNKDNQDPKDIDAEL